MTEPRIARNKARLALWGLSLLATATAAGSCAGTDAGEPSPVAPPAVLGQRLSPLLPAAVRLGAYNADIHQTSVSGISSGGYMAVQLHVAFSRDEKSQFKYVQDHFRSVPDLAHLLIKEEAHIFACGSINSMGVQLDNAIKEILTASGMPAPEVETIFSIWRQQGRFKKEIWG